MTEIVVEGWAVVENVPRGKPRVLIKTVSDTRRAALVNWLVTERELFISSTWTDEEIETMWSRNKGENDICTTVRVTWVMEDRT